ncbi:MAG: hypothetical protein ACW99A_20485 [Candidatus Kariarchaeaceae archaeon]|jgi:hypothetical protein
MSYEIRNYKEEYLEKHVEIGTAVYKDWIGQVQTTVDQLKQVYSGENFDPETKFYAFKDDKMVGFLTATVQPQEEDKPITARMEFPVVLEGYEEANNELFNVAYETLKNKGVTSILSRAGPKWGSTLKFVKEQGYTEENVISRSSIFDPNDISIEADTSKVEEFVSERDIEAALELFVEVFNINDDTQIENLRTQFATLEEQVAKIYAQSTIRDGDKMVGRQLMYAPLDDPDTAIMAQVIVVGDNVEENSRRLLARNLEIAKEHGVKRINFTIRDNILDREEEFTKLGFKFDENLKMYKKDL